MESNAVLTVNDVLTSKGFKNGATSYPLPGYFFEPFIKIFPDNPDSEIIKIHQPVENTNEDGSLNISYPRILYQRVYHIDDLHSYAPGFIVAMDTSKPVIKTFAGINVRVCTNLCVFQAEHLAVSFLNDSNHLRVFTDLENLAKDRTKFVKFYKKVIDRMKTLQLTPKQCNEIWGILLKLAAKDKNFGIQSIITAIQEHVKKPVDYVHTLDTMFNELTQTVTDSVNFLNNPNRTLTMFNSINQAYEIATLN